MQSHDRDAIMKLAEQISSYLESHPEAADSLEGIVKWWLPRQRYMDSVEQVNEALNVLIENGEVYRVVLSDGRVIYLKKPDDDEN